MLIIYAYDRKDKFVSMVNRISYIVSGNLRRKFHLRDLYEFFFFFSHNSHKRKFFSSKLYFTWAIKTQNRSRQNDSFVTLDGVTMTDSMEQVITEWMTFSLPMDPTMSADKRSQRLLAHLISLHNERSIWGHSEEWRYTSNILYLAIRRKWVVSFKPLLVFPSGKESLVPIG
jgi:hypothetical protein